MPDGAKIRETLRHRSSRYTAIVRALCVQNDNERRNGVGATLADAPNAKAAWRVTSTRPFCAHRRDKNPSSYFVDIAVDGQGGGRKAIFQPLQARQRTWLCEPWSPFTKAPEGGTAGAG